MTLEEVLIRLCTAAGLGLVIGLERELHGRSAGLRTQTIVAVSACLLMMISLEINRIHQFLDVNSVTRLDPGRVASYAVAGMGFLGAGAIIRGRGSVQGLTTAACLWAGNAVGLAVGAGLVMHAAVGTALLIIILLLLQQVIYFIPRDTYLRIYMDFDTCGEKTAEITQMLQEHKVKIVHSGFECRFDSITSSYEVAIRLKSTQDWTAIIGNLRRLEGLQRLKWGEGFVP